MGIKKSRKEYCLVVTIDGEDYYQYAYSKIYGGTVTVRLTKNENRVRKLKKTKFLEQEIPNMYLSTNLIFKLGTETLANSSDTINHRLRILEEIFVDEKLRFRESLEKIKSTKIDQDYYDVMAWRDIQNTLADMEFVAGSLPKQHQRILDVKEKIKYSKTEPKNVSIKILDASHNFRYSKLKKINEKHD